MENAEFELLLEKFDYKYKKGDLIKGTVCGYDHEGVIVDIGAKATAVCPEREAGLGDKPAAEALPKGESFEFMVLREEDNEGKFLLSHKKVAQAYVWKELEEIKAQNQIIEGTISSVVRGGVIVDVAGVKGFVPSSHLRIKENHLNMGDKMELKILSLDMQQNTFVLSNRTAVGASEEGKVEIIKSMKVGQVVNGEVVRITDFGAFVDIGGIDGLLPLSQISWRWVDHPQDVLKISDKIKVEIIAIDVEKQRVSLSLKNMQSDPWIEAEKVLKPGAEVQGTITRIKPFGAFVEILSGVEALLPYADLSQYESVSGNKLQPGSNITAVVQKFSPDDRRISLSVKPE